MLQKKILLVTILALLTFLVACQGEKPAPEYNANTGAKSRPVPAPTEPPAAPVSYSTPSSPQTREDAPGSPRPADTTTRESVAILPTSRAVSVRLDETTVPSPIPSHTATPVPASHEENVATIRLMVKEYWEAFNDYDADRALQMLEDGYRAVEEELIRKDVGRMKLFRINLEVSEETPPTLDGNGDYGTYLSMKTPVDSRRLLMTFRRIDGQWRIVFSDEVE